MDKKVLPSLTCVYVNNYRWKVVTTTTLSRKELRMRVTEACHLKNEQNLRKEAEKKCDKIMSEKYKKKEYLSMNKYKQSQIVFENKNRNATFCWELFP